jgi:hypothetical protein
LKVSRAVFASFAAFFLLVRAVPRSGQQEQIPTTGDFWKAAGQIRRLPPSAFKQAPKWVVDDLTTRGCTIPQVFDAHAPMNLIRGQFARNGEWDWAAICSKGGKSHVLVLWGGPAACPSELGETGDIDRLEGIGSRKIGYTYRIVRVGPDEIRKDIRDWEPPSDEDAKTVTHDGIEFPSGKGVGIEYCLRGEWIEVAWGD